MTNSKIFCNKKRLCDIPKMERTMTNISDILINEEIVRKTLRKLKVDKAMGSDGIHPKVLKECAEQLAGLLIKLFNFSLIIERINEKNRELSTSEFNKPVM